MKKRRICPLSKPRKTKINGAKIHADNLFSRLAPSVAAGGWAEAAATGPVGGPAPAGAFRKSHIPWCFGWPESNQRTYSEQEVCRCIPRHISGTDCAPSG